MELINGVEVRFEQENLEDFALLLLNFVNLKGNSNNGIVDVKTVEGTDILIVVADAESLEGIKSVGNRHRATLIDVMEVVIIEHGSPDYSNRLQRKVDELIDSDDMVSFYVHNVESSDY